MLAIVAPDFLEDVHRRLNRIGRPGEDRHNRVTDRLDDCAGMFLDGSLKQREVLPDESIGIEIAKAFIHSSRTLEVREQKGCLPDAETFSLVDALRSEQTAKLCVANNVPPDMYGSNSSCGLIRWATTSGGQLIRSSDPRTVPEFSTSMTIGPGGTMDSEGKKRCPSYLIGRSVGVVGGERCHHLRFAS